MLESTPCAHPHVRAGRAGPAQRHHAGLRARTTPARQLSSDWTGRLWANSGWTDFWVTRMLSCEPTGLLASSEFGPQEEVAQAAGGQVGGERDRDSLVCWEQQPERTTQGPGPLLMSQLSLWRTEPVTER